MNIQQALSGVSRIAIDTAPLIYFIERHSVYRDRVRAIIQQIDKRAIEGFSSVLTLTEVLTAPKRAQNQELIQVYRHYLQHSRNFTLVPITSEIAEVAADLRAEYGLKTPDAIQIATALKTNCQGFLTNDAGLTRVTHLCILLLNELAL